MAKDPSISETGNWNVASRYSDEKIMDILIKLDMYETASEFGVLGLEAELTTFPKERIKIRLRSLTWFHHFLKLIIKNSKFAIKNKDDKEKMEDYLKELKELKPFLDQVKKVSHNQKTKTKEYNINEKPFNIILDKLSEIKSELNEQLNRADLIFVSPETFDPKKLKEQIEEEVTFSG